MSVTKSGSEYVFKHTYTNGITMVAKFAPGDVTSISYEKNGRALEKEGFAELKKLTSEERMKVQDTLDVERLKVQPSSKFFRSIVAKVQGSDKLAEVVGKDKLNEDEKGAVAMTMDYRKTLKPILLTTINYDDKDSSLANRLSTTNDERDNEAVEKPDETKTENNTAATTTTSSTEETAKTENKDKDKEKIEVTPKNQNVAVEVKTSNNKTVLPTSLQSSGFRDVSNPLAANYTQNISANVNWAKTNPQFQHYPDHVKIALGYLGLKEVPGAGNNSVLMNMADTTGVKNFNDDQTWCAVFANYVAKQILGDKFMPHENNRSVYTHQFGRKIEDKSDIRVWDWVFFTNNPTHGGIFVGYDAAGNYRVLGGNQNNEVNIMTIPASSPTPEIRRMVENVPGSELLAFNKRPVLSRYVVGYGTVV